MKNDTRDDLGDDIFPKCGPKTVERFYAPWKEFHEKYGQYIDYEATAKAFDDNKEELMMGLAKGFRHTRDRRFDDRG